MAGHERYTPRGLGNLGKMTPTEDECVAMPDPTTLCILPWDRRFAHMPADLPLGGRRALRPLHPLHPQEADRGGGGRRVRHAAGHRDRALRGATLRRIPP